MRVQHVNVQPMAEEKDKDIISPLHWAAGYKEKRSPLAIPDICSLAEMERVYIEMVITPCHGNIPKAAELLEVSPSTLYRKQIRWQEE